MFDCLVFYSSSFLSAVLTCFHKPWSVINKIACNFDTIPLREDKIIMLINIRIDVFYLYFYTGYCMDSSGNILAHKASSWLSPCCWSLSDPQHCKYCWFYQMQKRLVSLLVVFLKVYVFHSPNIQKLIWNGGIIFI